MQDNIQLQIEESVIRRQIESPFAGSPDHGDLMMTDPPIDRTRRLIGLWVSWLLALLFHVDHGLMHLFHGVSPEIETKVTRAELPALYWAMLIYLALPVVALMLTSYAPGGQSTRAFGSTGRGFSSGSAWSTPWRKECISFLTSWCPTAAVTRWPWSPPSGDRPADQPGGLLLVAGEPQRPQGPISLGNRHTLVMPTQSDL